MPGNEIMVRERAVTPSYFRLGAFEAKMGIFKFVLFENLDMKGIIGKRGIMNTCIFGTSLSRQMICLSKNILLFRKRCSSSHHISSQNQPSSAGSIQAKDCLPDF